MQNHSLFVLFRDLFDAANWPAPFSEQGIPEPSPQGPHTRRHVSSKARKLPTNVSKELHHGLARRLFWICGILPRAQRRKGNDFRRADGAEQKRVCRLFAEQQVCNVLLCWSAVQ